MVDPLRFYSLEDFLLSEVRQRFAADGSIGAFDFFAIVIWKANRAKTHIARRLRNRDVKRRTDLEPIVRDLTQALGDAPTDRDRLRILTQDWGFALPMASAILAILWPDEFTVYDVRVCEQLQGFESLGSIRQFDALWTGYQDYREAVRAAAPGTMSLRDKDRYLWAKSMSEQLQRDIAQGFSRSDGA